MDPYRISVVVPVHNVEEWLPETLASIERQSVFPRTQVVLVDDGSTDGSPAIAQGFAARHVNVRYVRQDNAGLGAARNAGYDLATGDYLAFIDSDDVYPDEALTTLLREADEYDADVVVGDMHRFPRPVAGPPWRREVMVAPRTVTSLGQAPGLVGNPSACNKLFRTGFVRERGLRFSEGTHFEDVLFVVPALLDARVIRVVPELVYLYRTRGDQTSIMDSAKSDPVKFVEHLAVVERLAATARGHARAEKRAVDAWISYVQASYLWRSPQVLAGEAFDDYFARSTALFRSFDADLVAEEGGSTPARLALLAALLDDRELIASRRVDTDHLVVVDGQVHLPLPTSPELAPLTRLLGVLIDVRNASLDDDVLELRGTLRMLGARLDADRPPAGLLVTVGEDWARGPLVVRGVDGDVASWVAEIAVADLPPGRHDVALVVRDENREVAFPARAVRPLLTAPARLGADRLLAADGHDPLALVVRLRTPGAGVAMTARSSRDLVATARRLAGRRLRRRLSG